MFGVWMMGKVGFGSMIYSLRWWDRMFRHQAFAEEHPWRKKTVRASIFPNETPQPRLRKITAGRSGDGTVKIYDATPLPEKP